MTENAPIIVCDRCGSEFLVGSVKIEECSIEISGRNLLLNFFVCKNCGAVYKILIVDKDKYNGMVDDIKVIKKRICVAIYNNSKLQIIERLINMYATKKEKLNNYITSMNTRYDGVFTLSTSENNEREIIYTACIVDYKIRRDNNVR